MTSQNLQSQPPTRNARRGALSSFESLLRLDDTRGSGDTRQPGTGAAVLYLRVSTQRQMLTAIDLDPDGNSIATQREATIKRAKRLKTPVVKEFVEPGHSAQSIAKRPIFRELLQYVEDNPDVDYVIIYMRSRVFRNQTDAAITKRILDSMGVRLISAKEEFGEGYMADAMEAITDIMNEVQVRQSGEDISNKMYHKAKNGGTVGRARIGYLNVRKDVDGHLVNAIDIDPQRAPLITWAFEQYATGEYSLSSLQQELADQGLTTRRTARWEEKAVSRSQVGMFLRDPYYLGMVPYKGQVFPGKHPALVTPEMFDRVQHILDVRMQRTQRDTVHNHLLRGMLSCGRCRAEGRHSQLVYSKVANTRGDEYEYYLCRGRQDGACDLPHLPVSLVEDAILREVQSLRLTPEEVGVVREQVAESQDRQLSSQREATARVKKELATIDVKEERLLDLVADGSMTTDRVRERLAKLHVQRHALTQKLSTTEDDLRRESDVIQNYLDLLEKLGELYAAVDDDVKRKLLKAYFSKIWIDDDDYRVETQAEPQSIIGQITEAARSSSSKKRITEPKLGDSDLSHKSAYSKVICLNKTSLVQRGDRRSSKARVLPPTAGAIAKLAQSARKFDGQPNSIPTLPPKIRSLRRKLSLKQIEDLVARYRFGETATELSKEFGISKSGLLGLLREEAVTLRKQPMTSESTDRAAQLYQSGMSITEVVTQIGYSYSTVRKSLHESGIVMRPKGVKRSSL